MYKSGFYVNKNNPITPPHNLFPLDRTYLRITEQEATFLPIDVSQYNNINSNNLSNLTLVHFMLRADSSPIDHKSIFDHMEPAASGR